MFLFFAPRRVLLLLSSTLACMVLLGLSPSSSFAQKPKQLVGKSVVRRQKPKTSKAPLSKSGGKHYQKSVSSIHSVLNPKPATKPSKQVDAVDAFFKRDQVLTISIELSKEALDALRRNPREYVRATLTEAGHTYQDIGVHLRGAAGSFRDIDDKPGLTLHTDKFVKHQRFYGMEKFHLTNSVQDPTYAMELLCGEMFREVGVPAARIQHAIVTLNGRCRGLYVLKEGYDKHFLNQHFKTSAGNFYDGGFLRDIDQPLDHSFGKQDVGDFADLKALFTAVQESDAPLRFQKLEQLLDMDRFISYLAMEAIVWDWDGYPMNRNNYRIYHLPKENKLVFIPSGMDQMFQNVGGPILLDFQGAVAQAVMRTPRGRERYVVRLREIMQGFYRVEARVKRLQDLEETLKPALTKLDAGAGNNYTNLMNGLRQAVQERANQVLAQLKSLPATTTQ